MQKERVFRERVFRQRISAASQVFALIRQLRYAMALTICCCVMYCAMAPAPAHAQNFPARPVKVLLPYPPGGVADVLLRVLGQHAGVLWSQQLLIDNRPGASGIIATELAAKSPPDGYTLYLGTDGPLTINPSLHASLPYDWRRDFAPITLVAVAGQVLVVSLSVQARNVRELIALARQQPGRINYASTGVGGSPHLGAEQFKVQAAVDLAHIPYKGGPQTITALLTDEAQVLFTTESSAAPHVRSGKMRLLATTGRQRSTGFPDVPTVAEQGLPDFEMNVWFALFAPAGTPEPVLKKLNADFAQLLDKKEVREALQARGLEARSSSAEELRAFAQKDQEHWAALIRRLGIKPQ
jgi:tripartite-type tricarboxylate transporter receptor subunit TctC